MDDDRVTEHGTQVEADLLAEVYRIDIDGIEPALRTGSSGEEEGVYVRHAANGADDAGEKEGHANDVEVVDCDKVELSLGEEVWDVLLDELPDISPRFEGHSASRYRGSNDPGFVGYSSTGILQSRLQIEVRQIGDAEGADASRRATAGSSSWQRQGDSRGRRHG